MRWFAFSLMVLGSTFIGCAPPEEIATEPAMPSVTSGTTVEAAEGAAAVTPGVTPAVAAPAEGTAPAAAPAESAPPAAAPAEPTAPAAEPKKPDSTSTTKPSEIRFVATQSLKVPGMMCPYSCWPKVKETLAAQPGVEAVQLVAQAKEDAIDNPIVELKTNKDFDAKAAIAALEKASFSDAVVVN